MRENLSMKIHLNKKHSCHHTVKLNLNFKSRSVSSLNPQITNINSQITKPNPQITKPNPQITKPNPQITKPNSQITNLNSQITKNYSNIQSNGLSKFNLYGPKSTGKGCGCGR